MDKNLIRAAVSTLNKVEVRGKENLDMLLGCINALESLLKEEPVPAAQEPEVPDG